MDVMSLADFQAQNLMVLGLCFGLSLAWGVLLHRSHFCTMGAVSDWVLMADATRLRQWVLAISLSIAGFGGMSWLGWITPLNTIYATPRLNVLSLMLGGLLFGAGMVLSSGCVSKTLVRLGGGNLKALVVLMSVGIFALATLRGLPAVWRVNGFDALSVDWTAGPFAAQWLGAHSGLSLPESFGILSLCVSLMLLLWVFKDRNFWRFSQIWPGVGTAAVVLAVWWVSGVLGFVPEHPETLEPVFLATSSGRMESLSFTAPVAYWWDAFMYFSDGSKRVSLGMALAAGLVVGAWASALLEGTFRWEGFSQTSDLVCHGLGGALMGMGGVMAMGCSVGQGLSGLSTLSWGSMLAVSGIVLGALLALQWQSWRAENLS
jgi:uncharacterized membrane protein YedE/YeeE